MSTGLDSQFEYDAALLGWRAAMSLWLENRTGAPKVIGWTEPEREAQGKP